MLWRYESLSLPVEVCVCGGCGVVCRFMCCMSQGALVKMSQYASAEITVVGV